jgi:tripartite-type tricarboxylate transporter receptor subunit TctC
VCHDEDSAVALCFPVMTCSSKLQSMILVILPLALMRGAHAGEIDEFYASHPIKVVVGTGPGGGYDICGRLIARYLSRYVPGNPKVVVVNMPGASSLRAANYIANIAPKDGTEILLPVQTLPLAQVAGNGKARFDLRQFSLLGNMSNSANTVLVMQSSPAKDLASVKQLVVTVGATSPASLGGIYPAVMNSMLGTRFKIIYGYESGDAIDLALERGEVEGRAGTSWAALKAYRANWLREHKVRVIAQVGLEAEPDLNAPLLTDLATNDQQREVLAFFSSLVAVGRALALGPDVPADRVAALRKAFDDAMQDPDLRTEAQRQHLELRPIPGEQVQKAVALMASADPSVLTYAPGLFQDLK